MTDAQTAPWEDEEVPVEKLAFVGLYDGCKKVESRSGYVFNFDVLFDDADVAEAICGGKARPDNPVFLGITRITDEAAIRDYSERFNRAKKRK